MPNPVTHFEAIGPDGPALIKFYGATFDWKINADNPMGYGMVDTGEGVNGGIGQAPPDGNGHHLTWYVEVADIAATLKKIEELGGKTINPPMDVPGGPKLAHFEDPGGNFVGLVQAGSMG